jgi:hypothetical protein
MLILTQLRLKQLYFLLESVARKAIPISHSHHYPEIIKITRQILESCGISRIKKYESLLIQYVYNAEYTEHFMDDVLNYLINMAEKKLTGEIEDFLPSKPGEHQDDGDDPTDESDDDIFSEEEKEWLELEEQRAKRFKALQSLPQVMEPVIVKQYLEDHLDFQISDQEFENIEAGFRLRWKYANPQHSGDLDFQNAVNGYLTSIESTMDREKMGKVVDTILEYLQEVRLWGYPE